MRRNRLFFSFTAAGIVLGAAAAHAAFPLTPGAYVRDGVQCEDAPFAASLNFDGRNFLGAHESSCTTTVLRHAGRQYSLKATCRAAGDGSLQAPYAEIEGVSVLSRSRFTFSHKTAAGHVDHAVYRLCSTAPHR